MKIGQPIELVVLGGDATPFTFERSDALLIPGNLKRGVIDFNADGTRDLGQTMLLVPSLKVVA